MSIDPLQHLIFEIAEHRRMTAHSDRVGTVHEIQGEKMRVNMGNKADGTPWLSPWLHTTNHRGGSQDHQQFAVGQNVRLSTAGASIRQATVTPYAASNSFPGPAQMPETPAGDYQQTGSSHFESKTMEGSHNSWVSTAPVTNPAPQAASGQPETSDSSSSSSSGGGQQQQKPTPKMIHRVDPTGGITQRYGNDDNAPRVAITKDGSQLTTGKNSFWTDANGVWVTKPPKIAKCKIRNDNKHA